MASEIATGPARVPLARWRLTVIGLLRIAFGLVWAIDAWFKWQPDFLNHFTEYLTSAQQDQPAWVAAWIGFWVDLVKIDPGDLRTLGRFKRDGHRDRADPGCLHQPGDLGRSGPGARDLVDSGGLRRPLPGRLGRCRVGHHLRRGAGRSFPQPGWPLPRARPTVDASLGPPRVPGVGSASTLGTPRGTGLLGSERP